MILSGCGDPIEYAEGWEHVDCTPPTEMREALYEAIDRMEANGFEVQQVDSEGRDSGTTDTVRRRVILNTDRTIDEQTLTAWHELVHVRQYKDGLTAIAASDNEWRWALEVMSVKQEALLARSIPSLIFDFDVQMRGAKIGDGWSDVESSNAGVLVGEAFDLGCPEY